MLEYVDAVRSPYWIAPRKEKDASWLSSAGRPGCSEFLYRTLTSWSIQEKIGFRRGRVYKRTIRPTSSSATIAVRREICYDRFRSLAAHRLLQQLYALLRLQLNFFRPLRKFFAKERQGARFHQHYDTPRPPYSGSSSQAVSARKHALVWADLARTKPVELHQRIESLKRQLWREAQDGVRVTRRFG